MKNTCIFCIFIVYSAFGVEIDYFNKPQESHQIAFQNAQKITTDNYLNLLLTTTKPIISFQNFQEPRTGYLIGALRHILKTPIGKLLAYRILIEIQRLSNFGRPERQKIRDKNKSIVFIGNNDEDFGYNSARDSTQCASIDVYFPWLESSTDFQVINKEYNNNAFEIVLENIYVEKQATVWIFHEMLHWYHCLHDAEKFDNYSCGRNSDSHKHTLVTHPLSLPLYGALDGNRDEERIQISTFPWDGMDHESDGGRCCDFEEMLTIVGANYNANDVEGDCISENAYRCCEELPMRFGHRDFVYIEDKDVIKKAQVSAIRANNLFEWNNYLLNKKPSVVDETRKGLGNMIISASDDDVINDLTDFVSNWRK